MKTNIAWGLLLVVMAIAGGKLIASSLIEAVEGPRKAFDAKSAYETESAKLEAARKKLPGYRGREHLELEMQRRSDDARYLEEQAIANRPRVVIGAGMGVRHGYEYIKPGMTLADVQAILDSEGTETAGSLNAHSRQWTETTGSPGMVLAGEYVEGDEHTFIIMATFVDGRLVSKARGGY